ncbi:hypothetical protein Mucpa_3874 [Mucilaginibacter paludis DSM 18603]|uniref:YhhN family protein n=1 Tax=Mucilaginibacter paludis DSM 18603 TaxID=714943 RepID=H1Y057_9SPHI|nr:hypothetical protein Mucpa_3874 [Mucilaginibacter paludis DSM 18603]
MLNYITFSTAFEIQCFLVAIFCLSRDMELPWRIIPIYLLITCIVEFIGIYLKREHQPNQWPYNILLVCHIVFTSFMFSSLLSKYKNNRPPIIGGLVVLILFYAYDLFQHGFLRFNILCYNSMSVFFTVYSLFYFYLLLQEDTYIRLQYSADFWWVCGVLFFYFGNTAINLFRGKLAGIMITPKHAITYYIYIVLNVILYGCWSYSFICRKWLTSKV